MECVSWRVWIRQAIMAVYTILLIVAVVLICIDLDKHKADTDVWGWFVGGLFVLFSIPISLWGILQHIIHYNQPILQRREIRIMWMVPIYATDAWLALRFPSAAIYLDTLRECYEAYVIYNFVFYLMDFLWGEKPFLERDLSRRPPVKLSFPLCCLPTWSGKQLLDRSKHGVLQYVVIRPITTITALLCEVGGVYHEGDFRKDGAWTYLTVINSISQTWALYCLYLFYQKMKEDLSPLNPLKKFLCVKFVIFLSFWQQVIIALLIAFGVIKEQADWVVYDTNKLAAGIQDFAICIEMFGAAILHLIAFPHTPYVDESQRTFTSFIHAMKHTCGFDDVRNDVQEHVRVVGRAAGRTLMSTIRPSYGTSTSGDYQPLIRYTQSHDDSDTDSMCISFEFPQNKTAEDSESLMNFAEFSATQSGYHEQSQHGNSPIFSSDDSVEVTSHRSDQCTKNGDKCRDDGDQRSSTSDQCPQTSGQRTSSNNKRMLSSDKPTLSSDSVQEAGSNQSASPERIIYKQTETPQRQGKDIEKY